MRKILVIIILSISIATSSQADDIKEFEIEGMSIGDSLLDFFSESEIKKNTKDYYSYKKNFKFVAIDIQNYESFKQYYGVQFHVKKNDKNYIIYHIAGYDYCENDINVCYNKAKKIEKDLTIMFNDLKGQRINFAHEADKSGKSKVNRFFFDLANSDRIEINVFDWSDNMNYSDNYDVSLTTFEFDSAFK